LSGVDLATQVTGTLPVANGGTGLTSVTANRVPYGNGTSALQTSANLTFNGTTLTNTGNAVISDNSTSAGLRITQVGTGNALLVEDSANPDSTPFVIDADGNVTIGSTTRDTTGLISSKVQLQGTTGTIASFGQYSWNVGATSSPYFSLNKSRGASVGTRGVVSSEDLIGALYWSGDDGTNFIRAAQIESRVDGTPGTNDMPGRLVFSTTADGASSPTERMRIDSAGRVGIGSTSLAGYRIRVGGVFETTGTSGLAIAADTTIPSNVTGNAYGFFSAINTSASAFTLGFLHHYRAAGQTSGAGSTVTNQYGFHADSGLTGATNNYGFYSNIASGTGRWNLYAAGSAANYFAGNVGIGAAPSEILDISSSGRSFIQNTRASNNSAQPVFSLRKARGSLGALSVVQNGDITGEMQFYGYDGTNYIQAASIISVVDGTPGTNDMPGFLAFYTTADGASSSTERMRIDSAGSVGIGGTSFGSGAKVMFIANATTVPTTNPTGGGIMYVEGGALKYRGSSGTVTTIANA